jgi:predicted TIM-barrel fold metal-dependent hydrolase
MLYGRVRDKNIDHPDFLPVFEAAAHLRVPLFIHPQVAPRPVRQAYYSGLDNKPLESAFAMFGLGWHYETGVQFVRLVLSGVFDKYPDLQIILGHWGELVLFYLDRIDNMSRMENLERRVADYFKNNLFVTCSGMFYREFLPRTIDIVGIDRMLFSTDFPYQFAPDLGARKFVEDSELSAADKVKFAHGNWERLTNSKDARS